VAGTINIVPVRKAVSVLATPQKAFEVFTAGIDRWWPKTWGIGRAPVRESLIEPFVGGRWYTRHTDGTDVVVGHVLIWQPAERFVCTWEISSEWKPDARVALTSEVEVRFVAEAAGRTRVELEHRNFERMGAAAGEKMRKDVDGGWPSLLDLFAKEASAGKPGNTFVVHSIPGSPFGRAVLIALEEKGARYRLAPVAPATLRTPEHLARHPFGRVPILDHGEFRLFETQAILRYIDRVLSGASLTPDGACAAARMDQLMNINDWYLFQGVGNIIAFQRIVAPRLMGRAADEAAIAAAMPRAHAVFDALARELADQPYFVGDAISLADVLMAPHLDFLAATPEWATLTAGNKNLPAWLDRMNARASMRSTTWERVAAMAAA
jgi:glutathione S-transferase